MAKTTKMIFVKPSGIGLLLEGQNFTDYNILHKQALAAYKRAYTMIEKIKGARTIIKYEPVELLVIPNEDLQGPADRIIMIKDDDTMLVLKNEAFMLYQEQHFQGLKLLNKKEHITGKAVKVIFL